MDTDEANELGRFRRLLDGAPLEKLLPIIASVLDECLDVLRELPAPSTLAVEMGAAVSAELHKRHVAPTLRARTSGNA